MGVSLANRIRVWKEPLWYLTTVAFQNNGFSVLASEQARQYRLTLFRRYTSLLNPASAVNETFQFKIMGPRPVPVK